MTKFRSTHTFKMALAPSRSTVPWANRHLYMCSSYWFLVKQEDEGCSPAYHMRQVVQICTFSQGQKSIPSQYQAHGSLKVIFSTING